MITILHQVFDQFLPARRYTNGGTSYGLVSVRPPVSVCHKLVFSVQPLSKGYTD